MSVLIRCRVVFALSAILAFCGCDDGGGGGPIIGRSGEFSISGTVSGDVTEGVLLTLSGRRSAEVFTDEFGRYRFDDLPGGDYVVTPSAYGHDFAAASTGVPALGSDVTGVDFESVINPRKLPYAGPGTRIGIVHDEPAPGSTGIVDAAFGELIAAGVDTYELPVPWNSIETTPGSGTTSGTIDTSMLEELLAGLQALGLKPMIVLYGINAHIDLRNSIPTDLVNAEIPTQLAADRSWNDPVILTRYARVLDAVVPLVKEYGGYCISIGNEVNFYYGFHPDAVADIAGFTAAARAHVRRLDGGIAVTCTLTYDALDDPSSMQAILAECDVAQFTYYALNGDFTHRNPSVVGNEFDAMLGAAGDLQLILQEVGYASGYTTPTNGSSETKQAQFYANCLAALSTRPRIRAVSAVHLTDWSPAAVDGFVGDYGVGADRFREYLATLGIRHYDDGSAKEAYGVFRSSLQVFRSGE